MKFQPPPGLYEPKHYVQCFFCDRPRYATQEGVVEAGASSHGPSIRATLLSCDECGRPLLFLQEDYHNEGFEANDLVRVWPGAAQLSAVVPKELRDVHQEARRCFDAKAYTASVVMVGRTLEGVCNLNGINTGRLVDMLSKLKDSGHIDERLHDWTTELRVLRNEGAHFTGTLVNREDARDALDLCEALLDYIYVLREKFNEFRDRRAGKAGDVRSDGSNITDPEEE